MSVTPDRDTGATRRLSVIIAVTLLALVAALSPSLSTAQAAPESPMQPTAAADPVNTLWAASGGNVGVCESPETAASLDTCFASPAGRWRDNNVSAVATDGVNVYFSGKGGGLSCPLSGRGTDCTRIMAGPWDGSDVMALAASNGQLWIGQKDGKIYRCPANLPYQARSTKPDACVLLDDAVNRPVSSLLLANDTLYAGLGTYKKEALLWSCLPNSPNRCQDLDRPGNKTVLSLAAGGGYLWAGLDGGGPLWRCDLDKEGCDDWAQGGPIISVSYDGRGTLYTFIETILSPSTYGAVLACSTAEKNTCSTVLRNAYAPKMVAAAADRVYASTCDKRPLYVGSPPRSLSVEATPYSQSTRDDWCQALMLHVPAEGPLGVGGIDVRVKPGKQRRPVHGRAYRRPASTARVTVDGRHGVSVTRTIPLRNGLPTVENFDLLDAGRYRVTLRTAGVTRHRTVWVRADRTGAVTLRCPAHG